MTTAHENGEQSCLVSRPAVLSPTEAIVRSSHGDSCLPWECGDLLVCWFQSLSIGEG